MEEFFQLRSVSVILMAYMTQKKVLDTVTVGIVECTDPKGDSVRMYSLGVGIIQAFGPPAIEEAILGIRE